MTDKVSYQALTQRLSYQALTQRLSYCPQLYSRWRHYKTGNLYIVIGSSILEATQEPMVTYLDLSDAKAVPMTRPLAEWNELVEHEGKRVFRFTKVVENPT